MVFPLMVTIFLSLFKGKKMRDLPLIFHFVYRTFYTGKCLKNIYRISFIKIIDKSGKKCYNLIVKKLTI